MAAVEKLKKRCFEIEDDSRISNTFKTNSVSHVTNLLTQHLIFIKNHVSFKSEMLHILREGYPDFCVKLDFEIAVDQ